MKKMQLINFGNEEFHAYPNKSLYWKRLNTLIVSDLHIGKSISYAKNKQFLPPYDTKEILNKIFKCLGPGFFKEGLILVICVKFRECRYNSEHTEENFMRFLNICFNNNW